MNKKETDRFLEAAVRKHRGHLDFHVNSGSEHCVELVGKERKGSLWITPRYSGYRLQTTGQAQFLDRDIERMCGSSDGSQKSQNYQFWYIDDASKVERIIDLFAKL
jgi:hypothetical protein